VTQMRLIALVGSLLVLVATWGHGYYQGKRHAEIKVVEKTVTVMEKRNEIANTRPDDSATIKRLLDGTF